MSAWEALMWRAEADPRTRSTGGLLEGLHREPDWDRLGPPPANARPPAPGGRQPAPPPAPRPLLTPAGLLANRLRQRVSDAPSAWIRRGDDSLKLIGHTVRHPGAVVGDTIRFGRSLRRVLTPPPTERSPLLRGSSGFGYRFVVHDVPLSDLNAAGRAAGGSVDDALRPRVRAAFWRYHD